MSSDSTKTSPLLWSESLPPERMAGAEFVLPWVIDRFTGMLRILRERFTNDEAVLLVELHSNSSSENPLREDLFTRSRIELALKERSTSSEIDPDSLLSKFNLFDEQQIAMLRIWASAYWKHAAPGGMSISRYVSL